MDRKMISTIIFEVGCNPEAAKNMVGLAEPWAPGGETPDT
jgi:hypothetical protein